MQSIVLVSGRMQGNPCAFVSGATRVGKLANPAQTAGQRNKTKRVPMAAGFHYQRDTHEACAALR